MKICFLIANLSGNGGTERVTSMIANGLSARGIEVEIITCKGSEKGIYTLDSNIKVNFLHSETNRFSLFRKLTNIIKIWTITWKHKFDIVIAVDIYLYLYLLPVQFTRLSKCIAWEHFNYYIASMRYSLIARKSAIRWADKVIVLGEKDLQNYKLHCRNTNNMIYIYNPVAFQATEYKGVDSHRIIAAGRLTKQKGFDLLIDVWNIIESDSLIESKWELDIFGDGEEKENLNTKIESYGLKHIHLKGYTNDLENEMSKSSIFVLSSRYEGFVLVLLEAQAKGLPCISFDCKEGPSEIIDDGINGFLIQESNIQDFANKLMLLMNNRDLRLNFGRNAHNNLQRFKLDSVLDSWENVLFEL